jgi:hypothetical protein
MRIMKPSACKPDASGFRRFAPVMCKDAARVNGFKLGNRHPKVHAIEALKSRANMIRNCTSDKDASFSGIAQGNAHGAARRRQVS